MVVAHHVDGGNDLELVAVICPDTSAFEELYGIAYTDSALKKELGNAVRNVNSELKKYKQIHKFVIRREPFVKNEAGAVIRAGIAEETAAMLAKQ